MAEGPDPRANPPATPTLKELSNALDSVVNWYLLGVKLGMKAHELATIEKNYHGDNERCKLEMLNQSLRSAKLSSWRVVTDALQEMGEQTVARKIQTKYCSSSTDTDSLTAAATSPPATSPPATSPPATSPPATSPPATSPPATSPPATSPPATSPPATSPPATSPPATSPPATSPPATSPPATSPPATSPPATSPPATSPPATSPPATSPQSPSAVAVAQRNIKMIKGKFSILVTKSRRKLQSRKIDVDDVQTFLVTMYSSPDSEDGSDMVTTVVESARSLDEIFRALSKHRLWDYRNYYLLQSIIEEFADDDDELNGMMEQYQEDLTGYVLTLRIQTYLEATKHPITSDSDISTDEVLPLQQDYKLFRKLTVKCEVNITNHTLSYVVNLWRSLAKQFALPQPAMILHEIAKGCIGITWLIPANLVKYVTQMARETTNMFAEENVLRVTLEERCIYPMETEPPLPETKPPLQETEPPGMESETTALKRKIEGSTGGRRSPYLPAGSTKGNRSWDLPVSDEDERENPEDIPEYELRMKSARVMRTNYSFLWQYLEPSLLLPILVDKLLMTETRKKEAESYTQKFAQNAVIINQLFHSDCPPLKLCDTLDVTGQGHIARKLLQDYNHPTFREVQPPSVATDLSETFQMFQQLQRTVMDLLDQLPNALAKLKQVLASLVLPLGEGKVAPLVDPLAYENTQTVRELFRLMAPYWNPLSTDLLGLLLDASGCKQAASKVAEYVEAIASKAHLVLCIRQLPTLASGENDLDVADLETVHKAPLSELQSFHPAVFVRLPEHKVTSARTTVRISVEVSKPLVCIADYKEITTALSSFFKVPKAALVYAGCSKAPLVLCWLASHELVAYIKSTDRGLSGHRLLVENKVTRVAVGDQIYKCPTIKEVVLWEACYCGLMEQVHYLLTTGVNVNVTDFDGYTALVRASFNGHHKVVELLLGAGANPDLQDKDGFFPLYLASQEGHDGIVEMLLLAEATVDLQNKNGTTPLYIACEMGHLPVVERLIAAKADVNHQKKGGYTPLMVASYKGHPSVVRVLLQRGATVNTTSQLGETALHDAVDKEHEDIVELLLEANADPDLPKKESQETALMMAAKKGNVGTVRKLIKHGASVNLTNKAGNTAYDLASVEGHTDVCQELPSS